MGCLDAGFFDQGIDRMGTACEKWDELRAAEGADILPMWVADMDFRSPPAVCEALVARAQHGTYGYTAVLPEDAQALTAFWHRRHGFAFTAEDTLMLPCVVTGLRAAVNALTQPGDAVVVQPPVYGPFFSAVDLAGRRILRNPLRETPQGYRMDLAQLEDCLRAGGKLVLLCNPHNPVGRAWTQAELTELLALCARYDAYLVSDEIHADFVFPGRAHVPLLSLPGAAERCLMLVSASKTFNIAGLQQAACIATHAPLREALAKEMRAHGVVSGNLFALVATRAAYTQGDDWLDGVMAYLADARDIVCRFLAEQLPQIIPAPLEATYLMWLDCRALGLDDAELTRRTREQGRVALTSGTSFGPEGTGFLRLNIGCPHAQTREALRRLATALGQAR